MLSYSEIDITQTALGKGQQSQASAYPVAEITLN